MSALGQGLSHHAEGGIWRGIWLTRKGWDTGCENRSVQQGRKEKGGTNAFPDSDPGSNDRERNVDQEPCERPRVSKRQHEQVEELTKRHDGNKSSERHCA